MAETRPNVRDARWHNWMLLKQVLYATQDPVSALADTICDRLTLRMESVHNMICVASMRAETSGQSFTSWLG